MKILLTGGHLAPALATIQSFPRDVQLVYVGRKHTFEGDKGISLEQQIITDMGIPFYTLATGRLQRKLTLHTLPSLLKMPRGFFEATKILMKEKPDAVLGFGGYLSVPIGMVASMLGIPVIIHEQTQKRGLGNKALARFAKKICISWESSREYFPPKKIVLTGNPVMHGEPTPQLTSLLPEKKNALPILCIVGGSGGSHAINSVVGESIEKLLNTFYVIHQTGDAREFEDYEKLQRKRRSLPKELQERYVITKFIHPFDIEYVLDAASVVVSRAGINTISSLLLLNKPALLIPLPTGQHNEQMKNALLLEQAGLGMVLEQHLVSPHTLYAAVATIYENRHKYSNKKRVEEKELFQQAGAKIVKTVLSCINQSTNEKRE